MAENLKQRTISGALWSGVHKVATMLLGFISGIVLARLLTPHDFGVIGMLTIFLAVSNTFIDGGFGSALIQKKNPTDEDYSTILYWNITLSVIIYIILYFSAPLIAKFYNMSLLSDVLRVEGLVLIINAARIVQHNQLRKQLEFKKVALINVSSSTIALIVTIYAAWKGMGVWALVIQQLLVGALATILYWAISSWRPLLVFSLKSFKELFNFGFFILLSSIFNTICNNIQGLLIGKIYNSNTLGYFSTAQRTEGYASTFISSVLDQVSYPVLSEAQNDKQRIIRILKQFIGVSAFFTFPLMMLLILMAKPIIQMLYSEKWLPCVPFFQVLCIAGIAISLQSINYFAVAAIGNSKELFKWNLVKRALGLMLVVGGLYSFGLKGILAGTVATSWTIYGVNALLVSRLVGYKWYHQLRDLLPIITIAVLSFLISFSASHIVSASEFSGYAIKVLVFITVYLGCSYAFGVKELNYSKELVYKLIHRKR